MKWPTVAQVSEAPNNVKRCVSNSLGRTLYRASAVCKMIDCLLNPVACCDVQATPITGPLRNSLFQRNTRRFIREKHHLGTDSMKDALL